jgi:hypothetical protein
MKTTLTLQSGSFYFTGYVSLVRGRAVTVDLGDLPIAELQALKRSIKSGVIKSSEDIGDYSKVEATVAEETLEVSEPEPVIAVEPVVVEATTPEPVDDTPKRKTTRKPIASKSDSADPETSDE